MISDDILQYQVQLVRISIMIFANNSGNTARRHVYVSVLNVPRLPTQYYALPDTNWPARHTMNAILIQYLFNFQHKRVTGILLYKSCAREVHLLANEYESESGNNNEMEEVRFKWSSESVDGSRDVSLPPRP